MHSNALVDFNTGKYKTNSRARMKSDYFANKNHEGRFCIRNLLCR